MKWNVMFVLLVLVVILHGEPMISVSSDYEYYPGLGLYRYVNESKSWYDAFVDCRRDGAHLLILNSKKEVDLFLYIASKPGHTADVHWVGITDFYSPGHHYDIKGNSLESTGYMSWQSGFPTKKSNCVHIHKSNGLYCTYYICSDPFPYICEKEICT